MGASNWTFPAAVSTNPQHPETQVQSAFDFHSCNQFSVGTVGKAQRL